MNHCYKSFFITLLTFLVVGCNDDSTSNNDSKVAVSIMATLPSNVMESSGIVCSDSAFILTHNDSGDGPNIYEVDINNNTTTKQIHLNNIAHVDWEAIAQDDTFTYIGDFGNNNGDRSDLAIHKVLTSSLQIQDSVSVTTISFNYAEQVDFTSRQNHNFDCEAMISFGDYLYLFTKNRADENTNIYKVSKYPGNYEIQTFERIQVDGLLTAAAINSSHSQISLLGYNIVEERYNPFLWVLYDFTDDDFLNGKRERITLDLNAKTEAVDYKENNFIYLTAEANGNEAAYIYGLDLSIVL